MLACAFCEFWSQDSKCRIVSPCNFYICGWNLVVFNTSFEELSHTCKTRQYFIRGGVLFQLVHGINQPIPAAPIPPPPPGYCRTFACLVSPGGGAVANFALPRGQAFANPGATPALLIRPWFSLVSLQLELTDA